ncbi:hypothetical protein NLJ89_g1376 [Agrocybe chaxingu]|uniref:Fungal-type protein kinase domain-containing protein n=1 Tax=Agrocybe chaxingu TaxID=84603 RepID=A0A9W8N039_9AGAR|nr:hypothetical protein NLJ89_g1376 [Agrocybe chaxingu]
MNKELKIEPSGILGGTNMAWKYVIQQEDGVLAHNICECSATYLWDSGQITNSTANDPVQHRVLHLFILCPYQKLDEAASVEEFKQIFLGCVEGHHHAHEVGHIIHRDIDENNLMFVRTSNADVDKTTNGSVSLNATNTKTIARGILNDFDLSPEVSEQGNFFFTSARHPRASPFMASDFIKDQVIESLVTPTYHYRYDLESFFYILVWACTMYTFRPNHARLKQTPTCLKGWNDLSSTCGVRCMFFYFDGVVGVQNAVLPHFMSMWKECVLPLYGMFRAAFLSVPSIRSPEYVEYDHATCNGQITFKTFIEAMGIKPRNLEGIIEE